MKLQPRSFLLIASIVFYSAGDLCAQDESPPTVETRQFMDSVYLLATTDAEGSVTNSVVSVGPDGTVLVDHPGDWRTLRASVATIQALRAAWRALGADDPAFIINTHWHGDHTAGNLAYTAADKVAHRNVRNRLASRQTPFWYPDGIGPMPESGWPTITFVDSMIMYENGQSIHLWNFGDAHTDGDAVVYFEEAGVVHMGDLYHGSDDPSVGEDMVGLLATLDAVVERLPETVHVVTGHSGVTSVGELREYATMLRETIEWVKVGVRAGDTLAEVQRRGVPEQWRHNVSDPDVADAWLQEMYRTLTEVR